MGYFTKENMSDGRLNMEILAPTGVLFEGNVHKVSLPGMAGRFMVLPRHAPMISSLDEGDIVYWPTLGEGKRFGITGGFVEVKGDTITVVAETAAAGKEGK